MTRTSWDWIWLCLLDRSVRALLSKFVNLKTDAFPEMNGSFWNTTTIGKFINPENKDLSVCILGQDPNFYTILTFCFVFVLFFRTRLKRHEYLRRFVAGLLAQRAGLNSRPVCGVFVVDKVVLGMVVLWFPLSLSFHECFINIHSSIADSI